MLPVRHSRTHVPPSAIRRIFILNASFVRYWRVPGSPGTKREVSWAEHVGPSISCPQASEFIRCKIHRLRQITQPQHGEVRPRFLASIGVARLRTRACSIFNFVQLLCGERFLVSISTSSAHRATLPHCGGWPSGLASLPCYHGVNCWHGRHGVEGVVYPCLAFAVDLSFVPRWRRDSLAARDRRSNHRARVARLPGPARDRAATVREPSQRRERRERPTRPEAPAVAEARGAAGLGARGDLERSRWGHPRFKTSISRRVPGTPSTFLRIATSPTWTRPCTPSRNGRTRRAAPSSTRITSASTNTVPRSS